jgi:hypothetical protein
VAGPNSGEVRVGITRSLVEGRRGRRPWVAPLSVPDHHRPGPGHGLRLDEGPAGSTKPPRAWVRERAGG